MTSEERHAARRKRREEKRRRKREEAQKGLSFSAVSDPDNLYEAAMEARKGVQWKTSVQRYMANVLINVSMTSHDLESGRSVLGGVSEFDIIERGKRRHITTVPFRERVVQKCLSREVLYPALTKSYIRNCTANARGRGTWDMVKRLKRDLARHYQRHGSEGYILLIDMKSYFASLPHEGVKRMVDRQIEDRRLRDLCHSFIDEYEDSPGRGLGLGSEPNQLCAVAYLSPIDHWATECGGVEGYGRYMDDSYAISTSREQLAWVRDEVVRRCAALGLEVNLRKTRIVKLTKGFTWIKKRWSYGPKGKVVVRPSRKASAKARRKLKGLARLVGRGELEPEDMERSYRSWRGSMQHIDAHGLVLRMDAMYRELQSHPENTISSKRDPTR